MADSRNTDHTGQCRRPGTDYAGGDAAEFRTSCRSPRLCCYPYKVEKVKQNEAIKHLRYLMLGLQRYRSMIRESLGSGTGELHLPEKLAAETWPWIFGEKCPLPALDKIIANADGGTLAPADYCNMMFIFDRFMPGVKAYTIASLGMEFPGEKSRRDVLSGWDE